MHLTQDMAIAILHDLLGKAVAEQKITVNRRSEHEFVLRANLNGTWFTLVSEEYGKKERPNNG